MSADAKVPSSLSVAGASAVPSTDACPEPLRLGVLVGSPRRGNCAYLAREVLVPSLGAQDLDVSVRLLADFDVEGCLGCGACSHTGTCVLFAPCESARACRAGRAAAGDAHDAGWAAAVGVCDTSARDAAAPESFAAGSVGSGRGSDDRSAAERRPRGTLLDLIAWLDGLDALVLVAPLYFAGPPAQLKALFDRLQFLWGRRYMLKVWPALPLEQRRPALVLAVGGGGDPFGSKALVTCAHSALRMMDFEVEVSEALVGYRTGRPDVPTDAQFEARAVERASELAALLYDRGPFARRGQIDPLARFDC